MFGASRITKLRRAWNAVPGHHTEDDATTPWSGRSHTDPTSPGPLTDRRLWVLLAQRFRALVVFRARLATGRRAVFLAAGRRTAFLAVVRRTVFFAAGRRAAFLAAGRLAVFLAAGRLAVFLAAGRRTALRAVVRLIVLRAAGLRLTAFLAVVFLAAGRRRTAFLLADFLGAALATRLLATTTVITPISCWTI